MSNNSVLIVGAGALGITTGFHLQLAGADISYLVRENKQAALAKPQRLYCYNDHSIKTLDGYKVYTSATDLRNETYDFALLTLDGAACRTAEGVNTLQQLGAALHGKDTHLIICAVGIGLFEHVKETTGLPEVNLMQGTMGMFAYQVGQAEMPLNPPTDIDLHNSADIAYINFPNSGDFLIAAKPKQAAKRYIELFNQCGVAQCKSIPAGLYATFTSSFAPFTLSCDINDWQGTDALVADKELWHLCCQSQREIMRLKPHGLMGKLFAFLSSDTRMEKMVRGSDEQAKAMGYTAFNKFHHGGKVQPQNVQILENCVATGETHGQNMTASKTLLERWRQTRS